jgi:hypothetical protein
MPRLTSVATVVSVCALVGVTSARASGPEHGLQPVVRLVWLDPGDVARGLEGTARSEIRELLGRMNVALAWRHGDAHEMARPGEVRVILLGREREALEGHVSGAAPVHQPESPVAWVHLPGIVRALGLDPRRQREQQLDSLDRRALGIAIGRVATHEIVHAVAPVVPHGGGLMSAVQGRPLLVDRRPTVDREVARAVRDALRGEPEATVALAAATGVLP